MKAGLLQELLSLKLDVHRRTVIAGRKVTMREISLNASEISRRGGEMSDDSGLADRLREMIGDGSGRAFAAAAGVKDGTLRSVLNGVRPSVDFVVAIAQAHNVSIAWLAAGEGPKSNVLAAPAEQTLSPAENDNLVQIPRFDVRAAAGAGAVTSSENVSSYVTVDRRWLWRMMPGWAPPNAEIGILEIEGDSMYPTLMSGDLVIAIRNPPARIVDAGGIFFVLHHGQLRVKRLQVDMASGDISLISDNDYYQPEVVKRDHLEHDLKVLAMAFIKIGRM